MIVKIIRFEENKIYNHVVTKIKDKLLHDNHINLIDEEIENLSQEIVLTSQRSYLEIADIIKEYIKVTPQKRFGLARSIKGLLDEYSQNS